MLKPGRHIILINMPMFYDVRYVGAYLWVLNFTRQDSPSYQLTYLALFNFKSFVLELGSTEHWDFGIQTCGTASWVSYLVNIFFTFLPGSVWDWGMHYTWTDCIGSENMCHTSFVWPKNVLVATMKKWCLSEIVLQIDAANWRFNSLNCSKYVIRLKMRRYHSVN